MAITDAAVAEFLRCSMGLSAWKRHGTSRWALRVNPSSGNLHPTEAYIVREGSVSHYAPDAHALELRTRMPMDAWRAFTQDRAGFLVALTSVYWREAWKYGERAFRYCQHDVGHAIGALRLAAAMLGWRLALLPQFSDDDIAALCGVDRDDDYGEAEREDAGCIAIVTPGAPDGWRAASPRALVEAARSAPWSGRANRLSPSRIEWPAIDAVARATRYSGPENGARAGTAHVEPGTRSAGPGGGDSGSRTAEPGRASVDSRASTTDSGPERQETESGLRNASDPRRDEPRARAIVLQRRSALGFDARSSLPRDVFLAMLTRLRPPRPPWDAIDWPPHIHLLLFVHRVDGMVPGLYAWLRDPAAVDEWRAAMRAEFMWEPVAAGAAPPDLFLLVPTDVTWIANRLSCDQDIAADGFFSAAMIARVEPALRSRGEWFYRRLFWEAGMVGQVLYLEAEAAGARSTGIGCFYDDPVHEMAGLAGHAWQSLYHFSMGVPVDDGRLTTEPGYAGEGET